ncbi:short-chain dehydrogenase/reductase-like protein SDR [Lindgomyces ingoldianus]|uniref:Short-chain dehydrogenase/reductase-like protein SDR n=1 Tax=Lindgomyces ingoldianus TaxID=673940 RepID=A0ACB6RCC9_9PLEO|nr:short-chain dehydrogenase/reductase-like protein SDR [Lindgomyces ingoldianus]KAF2476380.1 short-chain dehydrogenase/reductase-like protein SDR [Lindgomyces ingoldianus]
MAPYSLPPDAVWFITGCSTGIGNELVSYLTTNTSSRVVATARNPSSLSSLPTTPNTLKLALDVTSESSIRAALTATLQKWSRIDVLVNNAGYGLLADTEGVPMSQAHSIMETNFFGAALLTQLTLPIFRDNNPTSGQQGGVVLQVTSMGGRLAFPGNAFYHASKFALEGFTEAVSKEMPEEWNIHFCCIEPGGVKTNYISTSTAQGGEVPHPAYTDPKLPTNQIRVYKSSPEATRNWAEAGDVVRAMYEIVRNGAGSEGEIPLRLPLGSDSWGMQKLGLEKGLRDLEDVKGVSLKTSGKEQLESIRFLKV